MWTHNKETVSVFPYLTVLADASFMETKDVQTGSGAHPASCLIRTENPSQGVKPRGVSLATHFHLVQRLRMSELNLSSPCAFMVCTGTTLHENLPAMLIRVPTGPK